MTDGPVLHVFPRQGRGAVDQALPSPDLRPSARGLDLSGRLAAGAAHITHPGRAQRRGESQARRARARRLRA